ncbi:MAG TPA: DUF523 domain-containing protein [Vicinamibacterales bacterium]|nr:DUF523 domain-containing protein [Vicinamibacterales bacterium]
MPAKVLVSSCLLGAEVRYHGGAATIGSAILDRWRAEGRIVDVCPEVAGGLSTPRPPAERVGVRVLTNHGQDVTAAFDAGATRAVAMAQQYGVRVAVLKSRSPSCGISAIFDGTFAGQLKPGMGVTAEALSKLGVRLFDETQLAEADAALRSLDAGDRSHLP